MVRPESDVNRIRPGVICVAALRWRKRNHVLAAMAAIAISATPPVILRDRFDPAG